MREAQTKSMIQIKCQLLKLVCINEDACLSVFSQEPSHLLITTTIIFRTVKQYEWMNEYTKNHIHTHTHTMREKTHTPPKTIIIHKRGHHIKATEQINNFQYITWR